MSETNLKRKINALLREAEKSLIIVDHGNKISVGPYSILQEDDTFQLSRDGEVINIFNSKKSAVAYAISKFNRTNHYIKIVKHDAQIGKYRDDIKYYKHSLAKAQRRKDYFREGVMLNRLDQAFLQLHKAKTTLMNEIKNIKIA